MNNSPVFISVLYRSGSSLLNMILNQSEELHVSYDTIHFMRHSYGLYRPIEQNYRKLVEDTAARVRERWDITIDPDKAIANIETGERVTEARVYDALMRAHLRLTDRQRWSDRTAVCWQSIPGFLEMFPDGRVIHIYRDPRAVLASYKNFTYHPGLMYLDCIFASLNMFHFIQQREIREDDRIYLLRYEDLIEKPEQTVRQICTFLNIEFKPEMLRVDQYRDVSGRIFDGNSSFEKRKNKFDKNSITQWRNALSSEEIYLTELVLKNVMQPEGYELTDIKINSEKQSDLDAMINDEFVNKRYQYWLKYGTGRQAYPNENAYVISK